MNNKLNIVLILSLIFSIACKEKNSYINTRSLEKLNLEIKRFDHDFDALRHKDKTLYKAELNKRYRIFFPVYNQGVIRVGAADDKRYDFYTHKFLTDSIYLEVYDTVQVHFPDMEAYQEKFSVAFSRYHAIFPHHQVPAIYTHVSGFNEPIVVADSTLSISLESYLGPDHEFYKRLGTYEYQLKHKDRTHIVGDAMRGWLSSEWELPAQSSLLDHIIYEGKILFVLQQIVPEAPIETLIGISQEQLQWCERYESNNWRFMIEKKHLFSDRNSIIAKYIQDGPFFNFVGSGSSPMVGKHVGWKIVSDYMRNNPDIDLIELLNDKKSQNILEKSKYKP